MNVWVPFYDDLDWLVDMVATIPDGVHVYAVDGRHDTFPGETLLTPGAEEWCGIREGVTYCAPSADRLPWGHEYSGVGVRGPQHEKAKYANYEVLPQDEWVLKLDTDERVTNLEVDRLADLNPNMRYSPWITPLDERGYQPMRLYVPGHWTFWLADQYFPREFYPRNTPVEELVYATVDTKHGVSNLGGQVEWITIENRGTDRPEEYRERRQEQLKRIGRARRAGDYDDSVT